MKRGLIIAFAAVACSMVIMATVSTTGRAATPELAASPPAPALKTDMTAPAAELAAPEIPVRIHEQHLATFNRTMAADVARAGGYTHEMTDQSRAYTVVSPAEHADTIGGLRQSEDHHINPQYVRWTQDAQERVTSKTGPDTGPLTTVPIRVITESMPTKGWRNAMVSANLLGIASLFALGIAIANRYGRPAG